MGTITKESIWHDEIYALDEGDDVKGGQPVFSGEIPIDGFSNAPIKQLSDNVNWLYDRGVVQNVKQVYEANTDFIPGATTELQVNSIQNILELATDVFFDGLFQQPTEYTVENNTVSFSAPIPEQVSQVAILSKAGFNIADVDPLGSAQAVRDDLADDTGAENIGYGSSTVAEALDESLSLNQIWSGTSLTLTPGWVDILSVQTVTGSTSNPIDALNISLSGLGSRTEKLNQDITSLAAVASSGEYSDLSGTPNIPAEQVKSDWNATGGYSEILNKPILAAVAETGNYEDLINKPTIPDSYNLPDATTSVKGGVIVGSGLSAVSGTLSVENAITPQPNSMMPDLIAPPDEVWVNDVLKPLLVAAGLLQAP